MLKTVTVLLNGASGMVNSHQLVTLHVYSSGPGKLLSLLANSTPQLFVAMVHKAMEYIIETELYLYILPSLLV